MALNRVLWFIACSKLEAFLFMSDKDAEPLADSMYAFPRRLASYLLKVSK
jgi:hypothetical protein